MPYTEFFSDRRTIRDYSPRTVPQELIDEMLEEASHAPTCGNMQLYSVVVTRNPEGKAALAPAHFNQPMVTSCQAVLTFCADFNRFTHWCTISDADPGYDNFQSFISAMLDTAIFAQQFCTIAELRGLGTCYLGTTTWNAPQIAETLELPRMVVPIITVTIGYPANPGAVSDRLSIDAIIHREKYNDYDDESVHWYYEAKERMDDSRRFIEENGKQTLAQVFTDVRYPRSANEEFSAIFYKFLEAAGFHWPSYE